MPTNNAPLSEALSIAADALFADRVPLNPDGSVPWRAFVGFALHLAEGIRVLSEQVANLTEQARPEGQLYTIEEVADKWQVSRRTVANLFSEGKLVATYINGSQRFSLEAIEAAERAGIRNKPKRKSWSAKAKA